MKKRFSVVLALAMVFVMMMGSGVMAAPAVGEQISNVLEAEITVEEVETPEKTIQELINDAGDKGTVEVPEGIYEEDITISKSLTLKGAGKDSTIIKGSITIAAADVTVEGFTIRESSVDRQWGIKINTGTKAIIKDNYIVDNGGNGIWVNLKDNDGLTVENNVIEKNRTGINFDSHTENVAVTIKDNKFLNNNAHGISIGTGGATFTITGNTFDGNQRSHFSDRRYSEESDENVSPSRKDIVNENTIKGLHAWAWNSEDSRWLLVPTEGEMLKMSWVMDEGQTDGTLEEDNVLTVIVDENKENKAVVKAEFAGDITTITEEGIIKEIGKVLFIMEIKDEQGNFVDNSVVTATAFDEQSLGCKDNFWHWGDIGGFSFAYEEGAVTGFNYKFNKAGTYNITIYAVQLNGNE